MGRKKIAITRIQDERNRQITFSKRKGGLLKKAYELSILCDVEIAVIMITSNSKLYQYASSNMNSILIRYTEFKDPDESKTNADILEDVTKKEKGGAAAHDDSGEEEESSGFLLTPRTQAHYRRIDEEFDHMLRHNQLQAMPSTLGSAPAAPSSMSTHVPSAMPVSVPVGHHHHHHMTHGHSSLQQLQQHLQQQMEQRSLSARSSAGSSTSASSVLSPPSAGGGGEQVSSAGSSQGGKSPLNMPPPLNTPTRLQTLRNQTLKLHLPGSGRNYIALGGPGGSGTSPKKASQPTSGGEEEEERAGGGAGGNKPHLRVVIPGQKDFVPRTQSTSPLLQVGFSTAGGGGGTQLATQPAINTESLSTPHLNLATPNLLSSLPPLFSSFMGEFPFGPPTSSSTAGGGVGGDLHSAASALVAFPVSIQPSSVSGSTSGTSNIILQAQNMGQPFLLTPSYDGRNNPLFASGSQPFTPPTTLAGISPNQRDLEQLKLQYDRLQQQILQQQLLIQHGLHQQHHQQSKEGTTQAGLRGEAPSQKRQSSSSSQDQDPPSQASQFNASDVLTSSQAKTATLPAGGVDSEPTASKRPRLDSSSL